jgi:hypothetical protein
MTLDVARSKQAPLLLCYSANTKPMQQNYSDVNSRTHSIVFHIFYFWNKMFLVFFLEISEYTNKKQNFYNNNLNVT